MRMRPSPTLILALALLVSTAALADAPRISAGIDWQNAVLTVEIRADVPATGRNPAAAEHAVRREIERDLARIVQEALLQVRLDDARTVADLVQRDPRLVASISQIATQARRVRAHRTHDLREVITEYHLPLFPTLAEIVFTHADPAPVPRSVGWVPTRRFTGIVIVADRTLPVHGTSRQGQLVPALMPRIHDREMRTVLAPDMLLPELLRSGGVIRYAGGLDDPLIRAVAGDDPLRIVASGLFGLTHTDLLIPAEAADRILFSAENRELLRSGRVVVVIPPDSVRQTTEIRPGPH